MFRRILPLVIKELQMLLGDPGGRRLLIMPVVLQLLLFPAAATLEVKNNVLAVLNQDGGAASVELIQRLSLAQAFSKVLRVEGQAGLTAAIEGQEALLAVVFPPDFSRHLETGLNPSVQVILDGRRSNSGQIALGYVNHILETYQRERADAGTGPKPVPIAVRHWFNPNLTYHWFVLPSLVATITTASTLIVTSLSLAREREHGTFDQLLVSPLTPELIMIGKAIPAMLVGTVQGTMILLAGIFIYGVPFQGSAFLLYASMFFYLLALVGFGLFISSICATQQQAFLGVFCFMMPAVLLSGFSAPIENMPEWLQLITWADPLRHFIVVVKGVFLKDMGAMQVAEHTLPLLAIAAATITAAAVSFRRRLA